MTKVFVGQVWKPKDNVHTVTVLEVTKDKVRYKWNRPHNLEGDRGLTQFLYEWELVPDDALPEAPKEVMYFPDADCTQSRILIRETDRGLILGTKLGHQALWQLLDSETALQLSHDLLRMGLALKRKTNGNSL